MNTGRVHKVNTERVNQQSTDCTQGLLSVRQQCQPLHHHAGLCCQLFFRILVLNYNIYDALSLLEIHCYSDYFMSNLNCFTITIFNVFCMLLFVCLLETNAALFFINNFLIKAWVTVCVEFLCRKFRCINKFLQYSPISSNITKYTNTQLR